MIQKAILDQRHKLRSGMGAYTGAARRRVHLAMELLRPPSGHRPDRRQARHTHILQIGFRLAIAQADARPVMHVSLRRTPSDAFVKRVDTLPAWWTSCLTQMSYLEFKMSDLADISTPVKTSDVRTLP